MSNEEIYVTFGQAHEHDLDHLGQFDRNTVAKIVISEENFEDPQKHAREIFHGEWSRYFTADSPDMSFYSDGVTIILYDEWKEWKKERESTEEDEVPEQTDRPQMTVSELQERCHQIAVNHGWWEEEREVGTLIALMHSELSEGLEAVRDGNFKGKDGLIEELADTIIRILDLAGHMEWDLEKAILDKMSENAERDYRHGDKNF